MAKIEYGGKLKRLVVILTTKKTISSRGRNWKKKLRLPLNAGRIVQQEKH